MGRFALLAAVGLVVAVAAAQDDFPDIPYLRDGFADVPAGHWAAAAVGNLRQARILHGYPVKPVLRLETRKHDPKLVVEAVARWKKSGMLVSYPDGLPKRAASRYEDAACAWAALNMLVTWSEWRLISGLTELPPIMAVLSMCREEAAALGIDEAAVRPLLDKLMPHFDRRAFGDSCGSHPMPPLPSDNHRKERGL